MAKPTRTMPFVHTERTRKALWRIKYLHTDGVQKDYSMALLLIGPPRCGKTFVANYYVEEYLRSKGFDPFNIPPGVVPPVVRVEVTPNCTIKSFSTDVLIKLLDPDPDYGSSSEKTRRICEAIEAHGVELLVFDEIQRLIDSDTMEIKREVANWVTGLLNRGKCPILLVGETRVERVFDDNRHLDGRSFGAHYMEPFQWAEDPGNTQNRLQDRLEFRSVIAKMELALAMPEKSNLSSVDTALRIYAFSRGLLGQVDRLLLMAKAIAERDDRPCITHDILAEAVDLLRVGRAKRLPNPFRVAQPEAGDPAPMNMEDGEEHVPAKQRKKEAV